MAHQNSISRGNGAFRSNGSRKLGFCITHGVPQSSIQMANCVCNDHLTNANDGSYGGFSFWPIKTHFLRKVERFVLKGIKKLSFRITLLELFVFQRSTDCEVAAHLYAYLSGLGSDSPTSIPPLGSTFVPDVLFSCTKIKYTLKHKCSSIIKYF